MNIHSNDLTQNTPKEFPIRSQKNESVWIKPIITCWQPIQNTESGCGIGIESDAGFPSS